MKYVVLPTIVSAIYCFCTGYGEDLRRSIDKAIKTGKNCSQVCVVTYGQSTEETTCSSASYTGRCSVCTLCSRCTELD